MNGERGRNVPLSLPRKWMADVMHLASGVPTVAVERTLRVRAVADARKRAQLAIGWGTLVVKAMATVSMRIPEMRWAYMPYPWPHFYEAPYSVALIVVERELHGERAVFFAPMLHPERLSLDAVQGKLDAFKNAPLESIGPYRRLMRTTRLPRPLRRLVLNVGMFGSGLTRGRLFGTYGVNSMALLRVKLVQTMIPITSNLFYDSVNRQGEMTVQLAFDHRVFDGSTAGRVLGELESVLNGEMLNELSDANSRRAA